MKIFTLKYNLFVCFTFLLFVVSANAKSDSLIVAKAAPSDTSKLSVNADAIYNRPFLQLGKLPVALGGYMEVNTHYSGTDGVPDNFSFQFRRFTMFMSSTITNRVKFLSELEFEGGTKEINIEFAAVDFEFHPLLNLRGGIVMNPIGAFNQNHDGPKWEFVERPLSATQMLPATWSNAGFGLHGKLYQSNLVFAYEAYITNGFDESIISNVEGKTFLPATKQNEDRFEESFNGKPMFTGKLAMRHRKIGELGVSYMGGDFSKQKLDGVVIDKARRLDVLAVDVNSTIKKTKTTLVGEFAWVFVDTPKDYIQNYGKKQHGGFIDIVQPIVRKKIFGWENALVNVALRTEYVDWNVGMFENTNLQVYENAFSVSPGISFRPSPQTVLRYNYRYYLQKDIVGNPPSRAVAMQFGLSSYF